MIRPLLATYGTPEQLDDFFAGHLKTMRDAERATVRRAGQVLTETFNGYGIGYRAPAGLIAMGQIILGNLLIDVMVPFAPVFLSNSLAMTCGALGAVYYGYQALTPEEKDALVAKVAAGFDIGRQLVRDMARFAIGLFAKLLDGEQLAELKNWLKEAAHSVGRHSSDITRNLSDRIADGLAVAAEGSRHAAQVGAHLALSGMEVMRQGSGVVADTATSGASAVYESIAIAAGRLLARKPGTDPTEAPGTDQAG